MICVCELDDAVTIGIAPPDPPVMVKDGFVVDGTPKFVPIKVNDPCPPAVRGKHDGNMLVIVGG